MCYEKGRKGGRKEGRERGRYGSRKSTRRKAGGGVGRGEGYQLRHAIRGQLDKDVPFCGLSIYLQHFEHYNRCAFHLLGLHINRSINRHAVLHLRASIQFLAVQHAVCRAILPSMVGYKAVYKAGLRDKIFVKPVALPKDNNS